MPLYDYQREDGTVFEVMQKLADDVLTVCPTTGQKVKKLISPVPAHFSGSGFYSVDYGGKNPKPQLRKPKKKSK